MTAKYDRVVVQGNYGTRARETDGVKTRVVSPQKAPTSTQHIGKLLSTPLRPDLRGEDAATKQQREKNRMNTFVQKSKERAARRSAGWFSCTNGIAA